MVCSRDCFNCPFSDCILDDVSQEERLLSDFITFSALSDRVSVLSRDAPSPSYSGSYYERHKEERRLYYLAHREERIAYQKERYRKNREKLKDYQLKRYYAKSYLALDCGSLFLYNVCMYYSALLLKIGR